MGGEIKTKHLVCMAFEDATDLDNWLHAEKLMREKVQLQKTVFAQAFHTKHPLKAVMGFVAMVSQKIWSENG